MEGVERYQGYSLTVEGQRKPRLSIAVAWVYDERDTRLFGVKMTVEDLFARRFQGLQDPEPITELAITFARRWAHGLIDTGMHPEDGEVVEQFRRAAGPDSSVAPALGVPLKAALLEAFARMDRVSGRVDYAPQLDVEGLADVLGVSPESVKEELQEMATRGWIEAYGYDRIPTAGQARITTRGYDARSESPSVAAPLGGLEKVLSQSLQALAAPSFRTQYPAALAELQKAVELLVAHDGSSKYGLIGYACRNAMQEFAIALVYHHNLQTPPAKTASTVAVRLVIAQRKKDLGDAVAAFLDSLLTYWDKTFDLVQRLAKDATREGPPLPIEDARRVVFHTAVVMNDLAQSLALPSK